MSNLIDRDALLEEYEWLKKNTGAYNHAELDEHIERIMRATIIDAVPVVRCVECKHRHKPLYPHPTMIWCPLIEHHHHPDWFCAYGKKEEKG